MATPFVSACRSTIGPLYYVELDELLELGLLEQRFDLQTARVDGRRLYYWGDENLNRQLEAIGYQTARANPDDVLHKIVRVRCADPDKVAGEIRKLGARVMLSEETHLIVRGTLAQIHVLERLRYEIVAPNEREVRPRSIRVYMGGPQ